MTQKHRHNQPLKEAPDPNTGPHAAAGTAFALKTWRPLIYADSQDSRRNFGRSGNKGTTSKPAHASHAVLTNYSYFSPYQHFMYQNYASINQQTKIQRTVPDRHLMLLGSVNQGR